MKIGMVGMGGLGTMHYNGVVKLPDAQVVAICDVRPERLEGNWSGTQINIESGPKADAELGNVRKYANYNLMLRDKDIEVILIATPTLLHAKMAIQGLRAGKHVFSEKPMALTSRDAAKMLAVSKETGKLLQIGHVLRFWPEYVAIKEMIDSKRYGEVKAAMLERLSGPPGWAWENWYHRSEMSGGAILDLHIHDVDVVNWFFGRPTHVSAVGWPSADGGIQVTSVNYTCPGVPVVSAFGGWFSGACGFSMSALVDFEQATVRYSSSANPTLLIHHRDGHNETPQMPTIDGYQEEVRYFLDCIAAGKPNDRVPPEATAQAVKIVEAERKSIRTGRAVAIK
jgi:predicted dehydrogenase